MDYKKKLSTEELMLLNCGVGEDFKSPLDYKEIKPVNSKGSSPVCFLERLMLKLNFHYFGHLMRRSDSLEKVPCAGKDWRQEEKGMTEYKIVGWHHQFNGHEFEQALGVGDGQGSLMCCSPWSHKSRTWLSDLTDLNWGWS